jgi:hypothetical protein
MHEQKIELWNQASAEVWIDSDGDIGIEDQRGYSVIVSRKGAADLRDWLTQVLEKYEHENG